jgi:hypothetical protein
MTVLADVPSLIFVAVWAFILVDGLTGVIWQRKLSPVLQILWLYPMKTEVVDLGILKLRLVTGSGARIQGFIQVLIALLAFAVFYRT